MKMNIIYYTFYVYHKTRRFAVVAILSVNVIYVSIIKKPCSIEII